ncbi:MAG: DNA alkylation repair protein [Candidatus Eisenbacteria bacterium]|uniref:DNA alkylation repair protein n=1 Tax=Eiseniibacteriota bacterium TaxID=2212470 RepID=A0A948RUP2_UNCEI|nr:DNA alkylation repair protein [Candidatus Eisenbacteria bacterium]MBU1947679.1 DNA alkylation repair protein [Candidatus Eisenbacteria bacterium]MBU2690876.1 DNA alkylation repair protein [Candidatus Eisenbacteria bacterium]
MTKRLSPQQAAAKTLKTLNSKADKKKAESYQRYFKEPVLFFGLGNEQSTQLRKDLIDSVKDCWTIKDAVSFCNEMVKDPHMESRGIGFQVVAHFAPKAAPGLVKDIKRWLERSADNWALVDNLAPSVLAPLIDAHPDLIPEVISWTESSVQWVRRGATVAFVPLVKQKKYVPAAYKIATRLFDDKEDLMHKAVGWLLRETGKSDMEELMTFLLKHGPKIPRTSVRYAIERFPKDERKRLLEATKGGAPKRSAKK